MDKGCIKFSNPQWFQDPLESFSEEDEKRKGKGKRWQSVEKENKRKTYLKVVK